LLEQTYGGYNLAVNNLGDPLKIMERSAFKTYLSLTYILQKISEEKERYGEGYNDYDLVCPTYNGNPCNFRSLTQLRKKLIKKVRFLIFVCRI